MSSPDCVGAAKLHPNLSMQMYNDSRYTFFLKIGCCRDAATSLTFLWAMTCFQELAFGCPGARRRKESCLIWGLFPEERWCLLRMIWSWQDQWREQSFIGQQVCSMITGSTYMIPFPVTNQPHLRLVGFITGIPAKIRVMAPAAINHL